MAQRGALTLAGSLNHNRKNVGENRQHGTGPDTGFKLFQSAEMECSGSMYVNVAAFSKHKIDLCAPSNAGAAVWRGSVSELELSWRSPGQTGTACHLKGMEPCFKYLPFEFEDRKLLGC